MKKITLALLAVGGLWYNAGAQANITIQAPLANSTSQLRAPNGTDQHSGLKGCFLIRASELGALTGSIVNSIGFDLTDGAGANNPGTITVYLENTSDNTYQKGTSFATAILGMTQHYTGNMTVPATNNAATITLNFTPTFTYTGGGIYVAYEWSSTGPFSAANNPATYEASNVGNGNGLGATSYTNNPVAPDGMTVTDFRPAFLFNAVNTATNELAVIDIDALGKASQFDAGQTITAKVRNSSTGDKAGVTVSLTIGGANPFTDVQTITNVVAGAVATVTFAPYSAINAGVSTMSIHIDADENNANNAMTWTQTASCETVALNYHAAGSFTSQGYGAGATTSGRIYSFRYVPGSTNSISAVQVVVPSFSAAGNNGKTIFGTLQDANGAIVAQSAPVVISGGMMDVFTSLTFTSPVQLTANTPYYIGVGMPANGYFPVGTLGTNTVQGYYNSAITGGALTEINFGYLSIQGLLINDSQIITATSSTATACKGQSVTLTVTGATNTTYTWSPIGGNSAVTIVTVTPPGTSTAGPQFFNVIGTNTVTGCKTLPTTVSVQVTTCNTNTGTVGFGQALTGNQALRLFPNPASNGITNVSGLSGVNTIEVSNIVGQVVFRSSVSGETEQIDLSQNSAGQYFIKVTSEAKEVTIFKLIKN